MRFNSLVPQIVLFNILSVLRNFYTDGGKLLLLLYLIFVLA